MKTAYIVKAYRTAVGKAPKGVFRFKRPDELAAETLAHMFEELPQLDKTRRCSRSYRKPLLRLRYRNHRNGHS